MSDGSWRGPICAGNRQQNRSRSNCEMQYRIWDNREVRYIRISSNRRFFRNMYLIHVVWNNLLRYATIQAKPISDDNATSVVSFLLTTTRDTRSSCIPASSALWRKRARVWPLNDSIIAQVESSAAARRAGNCTSRPAAHPIHRDKRIKYMSHHECLFFNRFWLLICISDAAQTVQALPISPSS